MTRKLGRLGEGSRGVNNGVKFRVSEVVTKSSIGWMGKLVEGVGVCVTEELGLIRLLDLI